MTNTEEQIEELLNKLTSGNAIAICVSFIADKVSEGIEDDEKQFEVAFAFMDEVHHLIYKYRGKETNHGNQ